jgi:ferredoxin
MLLIDTDTCTDCEACKPECSVDAIFHEGEVPEVWKDFIELNREVAATRLPINDRKEPLAGRAERA